MKLSQKKIFLLIVLFGIAGCDSRSAKHQYTEVYIESPLSKIPRAQKDPHAFMKMQNVNPASTDDAKGPGMVPEQVAQTTQNSVSWKVPAGWRELKGSGFRMASFENKTDPAEIDCSIVELSGAAGGVEANIARWMGQIGLDTFDTHNMQNFINTQKTLRINDNSKALLVNFNEFKSGEDISLVAAIIESKNSKIFVKMTGTKNNLSKNMEQFISLTKSITLK